MSETENATNTAIRMAMSSGKVAGGVLAAGIYLTAVALQGVGATIRGMWHVAQWANEHRPQIEDQGEMSLTALREKHEHVHVSPALDSAELEAVHAKLEAYGVDFAIEQGGDGVAYVHMRADDVDTLTHAIEAADAEISALEAKETAARIEQLDATIDAAVDKQAELEARIEAKEGTLTATRADLKDAEKESKTRERDIIERAGGRGKLDAYLATPEGHSDGLTLEKDAIMLESLEADITALETEIDGMKTERSHTIATINEARLERAELLGEEAPAPITDPERAAELDKRITKLEREQAAWNKLATTPEPGVQADAENVRQGPAGAAEKANQIGQQIDELKAEHALIAAESPERVGETIAKDGQITLDADGLDKTSEQTALTRDNTAASKANTRQTRTSQQGRRTAKKEPATSERKTSAPAKSSGHGTPKTPGADAPIR